MLCNFTKVLTVCLVAASSLVVPALCLPSQENSAKSTEGPKSIDNQDVEALIKRVETLYSAGEYGTAEKISRQILAIREKLLGPDHSETARALNNLGLLLDAQGSYTKAESFYRRSLIIYEREFGPESLEAALVINNLANLYADQGKYNQAEPLYRRSLEIREKAFGPNHPKVSTSLSNLATLYVDQGRYSGALPLLLRSLAIREKALGLNHPEVSASLNNLANLYVEQGRYSAAVPLLRRALKIDEKALGPDHPYVAGILNNMAGILRDQGQYDEAEVLYRRSLAIREKALGLNHPEVSASLNNLANLYVDQGRYSAAVPLLRRSLKIDQKALGPEHPHVASILDSLAVLFSNQRRYTEAESLYRRSLLIREKALGADHPDLAVSLNHLAFFLSDQGKLNEAETFYRRSLVIREKILGPDNPDVAESLNNLVGLLILKGQYGKAVLALKRSLSIESKWLIRELPLLPVQLRPAQLHKISYPWKYSLGLIGRQPGAVQLALDTRLNRQGLLPEIEQRQALLLNVLDQTKLDNLQALTQQLASVSLSTNRRSALRKQRDELQTEIYSQLPELQIQLLSPAEVARALPADGVLVEFQRYRSFDGSQPNGSRWTAGQYMALVLKPSGNISAVPLGSAAAIDAQILKGLRASADGMSDAESIWAQLSTQVLNPLLPQLTGSRQWFLSPDGELNRVPFAALPAPQQMGTPLAQAVQLRLLTTGRELIRLQQPAPPGTAALVMANPNYDHPSNKQQPAFRPEVVVTVAQRRSAELGSNQWKPLPASEGEGLKVAKLLSTGLLTGSAASTTALQRQQGPRVLHIATHGFFLADPKTKQTEAMRAIQEGSPLLQSLRQEDPQLRSGLVFAGANKPDVDPNNDDGYLTAEEAVNLNLKGTELVVLSACSTGQGDVRTGEGVYGLQRSLTVAGARSTLLSLWKVDDAATQEFMIRFYNRLKAGEGRADALAAVQKEFRSGLPGKPSDWKEPYYWAAWQLVGDWRPINGL